MLKPAQLYSEQVKEKMINCWYDEYYKYYSGWTGNNLPELPDNCYETHNFVSVDKEDNVIGYISYHINYVNMTADNFGIISFDKGNLMFAKDLYTAIKNLFKVYHMNRISWNMIVGNPVYTSYKRFIKKYGGRECAYYRQCARLMDGLLYDSISFEILSSEFKE
jgi:hypothetical protein